jgi:imidazolonepropionase-like amidohydrolase
MSATETTGARRKCLLENVRVFDGTSFSDCQSVVIDGGIIGNKPDGADEIIDGKGGFLIPGLIDAHVHLHHEGHLHALASYGITTALDMAMWPADKMNGLRGKTGLPDVRSAGLPVTASGSIHSCMLPLPEEALLSGPEQADSFVQKRIDEGSDYIKLIADVPGPRQETLNAVSAAAHDKGKMVVAHASSFTPFNMALDAKADIITHAPRDRAVTEETAKLMAEKKVISVPTLTMMQAVSAKPPLGAALGMMVSKPSLFMAILKSKRNGQGQQTYENAKDSVTAMYCAGVPILAGTDCHDEPNSFFEVKHGESLHQELELLIEAGVSVLDALRAATVLPAEHFQLHDRGVIAEGKRADLVLLREDPTQDIRATRSIERVWCGSVEYQSVA